ncbi:MAG: hypothetical protein DRR08_03795 [Candidatus Parabeggiatoa sp. nov. 2]|nr:MAG: hypothetical protein B6247_08455 [Beggiatoa sp. 4572_84]RKZ63325.1 MAG: hypothetical protein DRR08_03795 [Gammaproteobacteria bacterium]
MKELGKKSNPPPQPLRGKSFLLLIIVSGKKEMRPTASLEALKDGIVIIGGCNQDGRDIQLTPLRDMPGSLIIINAIHTLLP